MNSRLRRLTSLVVGCLLTAGSGSAQTPPAPDPFERLRVFIGRWEGTAEGQPGTGFVSQYVEDDGTTPSRLVFTTEAIENVPAGWRARETYVVHGPDEIEEIFELAESGKPFEVYSRSRLKRVP